MRSVTHEPGHQLRSVALRYGCPLAPARISHVVMGGAWSAIRIDPGHSDAARTSPTVEHPPGRDNELARLEAILFLAREPLSSRKLAQLANLADGTKARTLIRRLNGHYDSAGRAFRVEQVAGGYQLLSRPQFGPWLRRLAHVPGETRFSAPALETLAVIAYRQPVPRADIEAIRGVNCGEILRQLLERDLVRIDGRSDELGRPYLYSTTKRFLQLFGLAHLDDLPRAHPLRTAPLPAARSPVTIFAEPETTSSEFSREAVDDPGAGELDSADLDFEADIETKNSHE